MTQRSGPHPPGCTLKISLSLFLVIAFLCAGWVLKQVREMRAGDLIRCAIWSDAVGRFLCRSDLYVFRKIDPSERNQDGDTLLQQVFYNVPSFPADSPGDARAYEMADWLIKEGASIDATNAKGMTLLMTAVVEVDLSLVKFLVSRGANPTAAGGGEFAGLSASTLVDRMSAANLKTARGLLSCDKEAVLVRHPEGDGHEVDRILSYAHFRLLRYVASASGQSERWADCQPLLPEEAERLMTKMATVLGLTEMRAALGAQALQ